MYIVGTFNNKVSSRRRPHHRAHAHGLLIHTWTFRSEQSRLAEDYAESQSYGDPANEYLQFYKLGIDGVFSDYPDHAFAARELFTGRLGHKLDDRGDPHRHDHRPQRLG